MIRDNGTNPQEPPPTVKPMLHWPSRVTASAVDLFDLNSPHTLAVLSVPAGATVLDVGCGPGIVAQALVERGCRVWGIELDPRDAARARRSCVEVAEEDLEATALPALFGSQDFDTILCLDVLEHLKHPAAVLAQLRSMLAPGGTVLISVPNVTHGALRLELLRGRFAYRSSGLLDHGHLRFFDARAVADLIRAAGLSAETTLRVVKRLDQTEFDVDLETVPAAVLESLEQDPDALTYQFFIVARPVRDGDTTKKAPSLPERLRARVEQFTTELEKAGSYARSLELELKARDQQRNDAAQQATQIAALTAELEQAGSYARSLELELKARDQQRNDAAQQATQIAALTAELEQAATYGRHLKTQITDRDARLRELEDELRSAGTYGRRLEGELSASQADVEALSTAEQTARRCGDDAAARALTLEALVADVRRLFDDQVSYARHLEGELLKRSGDLTIRDDELHVLRADNEKTVSAIAERDAQLHDARAILADVQHQLDRRLQQLAQYDNDVHLLREDLAAARRTIAGRHKKLAIAVQKSTEFEATLGHERRLVVEQMELIRQHRTRLAAQIADAFVRRAPRLYGLIRPAVAALAGWRANTNSR